MRYTTAAEYDKSRKYQIGDACISYLNSLWVWDRAGWVKRESRWK